MCAGVSCVLDGKWCHVGVYGFRKSGFKLLWDCFPPYKSNLLSVNQNKLVLPDNRDRKML